MPSIGAAEVLATPVAAPPRLDVPAPTAAAFKSLAADLACSDAYVLDMARLALVEAPCESGEYDPAGYARVVHAFRIRRARLLANVGIREPVATMTRRRSPRPRPAASDADVPGAVTPTGGQR